MVKREDLRRKKLDRVLQRISHLVRALVEKHNPRDQMRNVVDAVWCCAEHHRDAWVKIQYFESWPPNEDLFCVGVGFIWTLVSFAVWAIVRLRVESAYSFRLHFHLAPCF